MRNLLGRVALVRIDCTKEDDRIGCQPRLVQIAGKHEDFYDPDFYIDNDVIVHDTKGKFKIYSYPEEVFSPTDSHSATFPDRFIYIIGSIGYWIARDFWGKGIATHALALLLREVSLRPLYAHVATTNEASLRVLQKSGFVIERVQLSPADDRYPECEEAVLVLK